MPAIEGNAAEPPLADSYYALLRRCSGATVQPPLAPPTFEVSECELPMIDVRCLTSAAADGSVAAADKRAACAAAIARAAEEWGFFQVHNHGVRLELLEEMRQEQARLFRLAVEAKHGLLEGSYRWGTPTATSMQQLSWSEAFHVPLVGISSDTCNFGELTALK
jgi:gibberellin 2beta-dioxygenase